MRSEGRVREWHDEDGWGVLDSASTPGGCWAHFSHLMLEGYRSLERGSVVTFTFEPVQQDGYDYRAVAVWKAESSGVHEQARDAGAGGSFYHSTLTLDFDDGSESRTWIDPR